MLDYYSIPPRAPRRVLWQYILLMLVVLCTGYVSRRYAHYLPMPIRKRTGDALWACAVYVLVAIVRPRWSTLMVTAIALLISYSIEFSQIYHRPWIDHIRSYTLGRLILGATFFWLDQVAYTIGISLLIPVDSLLIRGGQRNHIRNDA
jgi:Protein of unknown function (DUF2809)